MAYLMGDPVQKATIVARGEALGYAFHLPEEERYLHTREELIDWMKIGLAGRAAEQVVFGRVTNGAASDLEKVTLLARAMVFEYGMSEGVVSRTMRADNYALSEDEAAARQRASPAHGRRVPRGDPAAREAPLGARPRRRRCSRRRR